MEDKNHENKIEAVALEEAHTKAMEAISSVELPEGSTFIAFLVTPVKGEDSHYFGSKVDAKSDLVKQGFHNLFEEQPILLLPISAAVDKAMDPMSLLANLLKR